MPVTNPVPNLCRLAIVLLLLSNSACQMSEQPTDNRYQRALETPAPASQSSPGPVVQLQNQALAAINEDQYAQATEYLQRAIKIQPRNGWSWYYLADVHQRQGEGERCLSMLQRADAYALGVARLAAANAELRAQCH